MKTLVKGFGGIVSDMLEESANDVANIQDSVESLLSNDISISSYLGDDIRCSSPQQSSSSSTSINGVLRKSVFYAMPVSGSRGRGMVQVRASFQSKEEYKISELVLQLDDGRVFNVKGGGGSGGNKKVIVVEPIRD